MLQSLTDELLELTAEAKGSNRAYFAISIACCCCTTSCFSLYL
jgi:streptolysin S family bacteriocin protoxin